MKAAMKFAMKISRVKGVEWSLKFSKVSGNMCVRFGARNMVLAWLWVGYYEIFRHQISLYCMTQNLLKFNLHNMFSNRCNVYLIRFLEKQSSQNEK